MKIRHIKIERFRGIRELDWRVGGEFVCLVGPEDSTKTTILDAVESASGHRPVPCIQRYTQSRSQT